MIDSRKLDGIRRILLVGAFVSLGVVNGCGRNESGSVHEALPVHAVQAKRIEAPQVVSVSGNVEPIRTVRFGFMVAGKVDEVTVEEGDTVEKGQFIASLETADYRHGLQIAEAKLQEIEVEYTRLKNLHEKESVTDSDFDKIAAGLKQARANAAIWRKKLADTRLVAPIGGAIALKGVEPGEIVPEGHPVFAVVNTDSVKVVVGVPETEIGLVQVGQAARVTIPAIESGVFEGRVGGIAAVADPFTRSYSVKIVVANPDDRIRAGMIALADITTSRSSSIVTVPAEAVVREPHGGIHVFVLDRSSSSVTERSITTGRVSGSEVEIVSGLEGGETVVVPGRHRLADGTRVQIVGDGE